MLTAMPTHNVNRDEDGRPKTALLGDTLRGRISSQAKKRALRYAGHLPDAQRAIRTRELGIKVFRGLTDSGALDDTNAAWVALAVNQAVGGGGKAPDREVAEAIVAPERPNERNKRIRQLMDELQMDEKIAAQRALEELLGTEQGLVVSTSEMAAADALVKRLRATPGAIAESW
jgi:CRISPR system Cascade subunit CasC